MHNKTKSLLSKYCLGFLAFTFSATVASSYATPALAQGLSEGERKNIARTLFTEGVKLQEGGKYADALAKFEAAQKNFSAPTNVLHIAECQALVGRLVDSEETYNTLARMKVDPANDPPIFLQAQQQGAGEVQSVRARIPNVRVDVQPPPNQLQNLQITFNDKPMPTELVGVPHQIDPGTYRVAAYANGYLLREPSGDIVIREKEQKTVMIVLVPVGNGAPPPPPPPANNVNVNDGQPPPPNGYAPVPPPANPPPPVQNYNGPAYLIGIHANLMQPFGALPTPSTTFGNNVGMNDMFSTGYAIGIDGGFRLARQIYLGLRGEYGSFGTGSNTAALNYSTVSTSTSMIGVDVGLITSPDRLGFWVVAGIGYRWLTQSITAPSSQQLEVLGQSATFQGVDFWGEIGIMIPVGRIRLVPNAQLALGEFSRNSSDNLGPTVSSDSGATSGTAIHGFLGVGLKGFYTDRF